MQCDRLELMKKLYKRNDKLDQLFPNCGLWRIPKKNCCTKDYTEIQCNGFRQLLTASGSKDGIRHFDHHRYDSAWKFKVWNSKSNRYLFIFLLSWSHVISFGLCAWIGQSWKETEAWRANKRAGSEWVVNKRDRWWPIKELSNLDA